MIRILHLCYDFAPSVAGIEQFVLGLATHSARAGLRPAVLTYNRLRETGARLPGRAVVDGIPVWRIPFLPLVYYKPSLPPPSLLRRFDVLHVHAIGAMLDMTVFTRALHRRPIVLSTHGGIFHTNKLPALKRAYFRGLQPRVLCRVARVVACSKPDLDLFRPVAPEALLIENAVELRRPSCAARHAAPRDERRLLFVGRLIPEKNIAALIRTVAALRDRGVLAALRIVGADRQGGRSALQRLARELNLGPDRVLFLGTLSDEALAEEYASAGFTASASKYEGFGMAVVEAMAAGCIPILNDIPPFRALIADGAGLIVNFDRTESAAAQIARLLETPPAPLRARVLERAQALSWENTIPHWVKLYGEVARAGAHRVDGRA